MFDSGISVKNLIADLKEEVDIAIPIPDASYVLWETALEQLLYTECIQEQGRLVLTNPSSSPVSISSLSVPSGEAAIRFEDIYTVYAKYGNHDEGTQLIKSTQASGVLFPDTFYKVQNDIGYNTKTRPTKLEIIYFVRPALKTTDNYSANKVMVPVEFIDLVKAKLRGEAYKVANEDELATKWLNDYNVLLETFKVWLAGKRPEFGM